jgi:hypothetical protein
MAGWSITGAILRSESRKPVKLLYQVRPN